jgi:hypothetical protein
MRAGRSRRVDLAAQLRADSERVHGALAVGVTSAGSGRWSLPGRRRRRNVTPAVRIVAEDLAELVVAVAPMKPRRPPNEATPTVVLTPGRRRSHGRARNLVNATRRIDQLHAAFGATVPN